MMNNKIHIIREEKCSTGNIVLRSDKILMFKPFNGVTTCNLKDLEEMFEIFIELTNGVPHLYYSDNTNLKNFGAEERIYATGKVHLFASAMAIKESSAIVRFMTHTMVYLNKPKVAIKMFKTEENAINWLKSK